MSASLSLLTSVAVGGAAGSVCRYLAGAWLGYRFGTAYPYGTLAVNVLGCLLMGLLAGALADHFSAHKQEWRALLGVGFLGGFTTFSAFTFESWLLIERGEILAAGGYILLSVLLSLLGLWAGLMLMRNLPI